MEHSPRFDLESAIGSWRNQLTSSAIDHDSLSELETHLRDSIAAIQKSGSSEEDAFAIASYRLGQPQSLRSEFRKAHPDRLWIECILWMLLGAQLVDLVRQFSAFLRGLVTFPRMMYAERYEPGFDLLNWFLWAGQFLVLALLLVAAFKFLRGRERLSEKLLNALRTRPLMCCVVLLSLSLGMNLLSLGATLLPAFIQTLQNTGNVHYDLVNLVMNLVASSLQAVILPAVTFWYLRRYFAPTAGVA